ncbi:MAG: DUF4159 domain-containing protein [Candidatus Poribacteria bacterium]|nr:DUF4159 domain-containing protein [Candidatus Poribacteria bacterium]
MTTKMVRRHLIKQRRWRSLVLSLVIHGIAVVLLAVWLLKPAIQNIEDKMYAELVNTSTKQTTIRQDLPKPKPKPITKVVRKVDTSGVKGILSAQRIPTPIDPVVPVQDVLPSDTSSVIENVTRLAPSPETILNQAQLDGKELSGGIDPTDGVVPERGKGGSGTVGIVERGKGSSGFGNFSKGTGTGSGYADLGEGYGKLPTLRDEIGDKLGGILKGSGADLEGHIRIIRLKHSLSDWWQDPTAIPSLIKWLEANTRIRADISFAGGTLPLTDPKILDAPLIIMTGHEKEMTINRNLMRGKKIKRGFSEQERAALRKYVLERGGTLFFDDCGLKAGFSNTVEYELRQIFPEFALEKLPHDHEIYNIFYKLNKPPEGGEVFWRSENKALPTRYKFHRGIYVPRTPGGRKQPNLTFKNSLGVLLSSNHRLGVIFNRKDYLCAMETAEIQSRTALRMRRSTDVYRFMTNLMVYTLKYGGNTDRSDYED